MANKRCDCGLRKSGERTTDDRLSNLPEPILYHILSFLNTKSAVQTSKLSRSWSRVWKHVPVLDLCIITFRRFCSFEKFVSRVLSRRYDLNVRKVSYIFQVGGWNQRNKGIMVKVIKYALSHQVQHLLVDTGNRDNHDYGYNFSCLFGSITNCDHLEKLELNSVVLDSGFGSSGFRMLTTLNVTSCLLDTDDQGKELDLFSNFPRLKNLVLSRCFPSSRKGKGSLRVYGPELVTLELDGLKKLKIEIFAPKLKCLNVRRKMDSAGFCELTIPSLDHADIGILEVGCGFDKFEGQSQLQQNLTSLFHGLHNARSLKLHGCSIQIVDDVCEFLEQQPSPFKRLECLIVGSDYLPEKLIDWFFKGSSCEEPTIVYDHKSVTVLGPYLSTS